MHKTKALLLISLLCINMAGCNSVSSDTAANTDLPQENAESAEKEPSLDSPPPNVNEAGRIPVIMYHRIAESKSEYDISPEAFKNELTVLYDRGYRPISVENFINGYIDVPAGMTPIVITFDDGDPTQYEAIDENGTPSATCALGILEAFKKEHSDFNPQAIFFVNGGSPFGQSSLTQIKISYMIKRGYWLGNHTTNHEDLKKADAETIEKTIGKNAVHIEEYTHKPTEYFARPNGSRPKDPALQNLLINGTYEGNAYENKGIFNVGSNPERPVYCQGFDPYNISRVRCGSDEAELLWWLDQMDIKEGYRYISDGYPNIVTVPSTLADKINQDALKDKKLRIIE